MGKKHSKSRHEGETFSPSALRSQTPRILPADLSLIKDGFDKLCGNVSRCDGPVFTKHVRKSWESSLAEAVLDLLPRRPSRGASVEFDHFKIIAETLLTRSAHDQSRLLLKICSRHDGRITVGGLHDYVEDVFSSFTIARSSRGEKSWFEPSTGLAIFAASLTKSLGTDLRRTLTVTDVEKWLSENPLVTRIFETVVRWFLFLPPASSATDSWDGIIPRCVEPRKRFTSLLALPSVAFLNNALPLDLRKQWRFIFSSYLHGDSFSALAKAIVDRGPTIIVVKERGTEQVFGGFASTAWKLYPKWQGTSQSFVFTLKPHLGVYRTTGFNDHYMYLNMGQQTLPNGLGMGGQMHYFGLWLDADFGSGFAAPSCTTYSCPPLCSTQHFRVDLVEVWGVGPEPEKPEEREKTGVLDADPSAKMLLEASGRKLHSEGWRDKK